MQFPSRKYPGIARHRSQRTAGLGERNYRGVNNDDDDDEKKRTRSVFLVHNRGLVAEKRANNYFVLPRRVPPVRSPLPQLVPWLLRTRFDARSRAIREKREKTSKMKIHREAYIYVCIYRRVRTCGAIRETLRRPQALGTLPKRFPAILPVIAEERFDNGGWIYSESTRARIFLKKRKSSSKRSQDTRTDSEEILV